MAEPLLDETPTTVAPAIITSHHRELRDLLVCPEERGQVNYIRRTSLYAHNITDPAAEPEQLCDLRFHPVCLSYGAGLLAAGGLHSELALRPIYSSHWTYTTSLSKSINNNLFVTSAALAQDSARASRTRLFVSNNDHTLSVYEVWIEEDGAGDAGCRMEVSGSIRLPTALNHSSISPDGRTLIAVGDTPDVFVLNVTGGPLTTMSLTTTLEAADSSFATAWSPDGRKFAVSSQNGSVAVWDVRSSKPLAKFSSARAGASTRSIKFTPPGAPQELLTFTEGSCNLHVVDAQTFNTHKTYAVPPITHPSCPTVLRSKRFVGGTHPMSIPEGSTPSARRSSPPAHLLLSNFHLAHYAMPSSPPYRSYSPLPAYMPASLYPSTADYKPLAPWHGSGHGMNTEPEITGLCWDPSGRWCYVGTEGSVVEWSVARADRKWCDEVTFA